jgi:hypothetical protein
VRIRSHP